MHPPIAGLLTDSKPAARKLLRQHDRVRNLPRPSDVQREQRVPRLPTDHDMQLSGTQWVPSVLKVVPSGHIQQRMVPPPWPAVTADPIWPAPVETSSRRNHGMSVSRADRSPHARDQTAAVATHSRQARSGWNLATKAGPDLSRRTQFERLPGGRARADAGRPGRRDAQARPNRSTFRVGRSINLAGTSSTIQGHFGVSLSGNGQCLKRW